jgi:hypothetical protein
MKPSVFGLQPKYLKSCLLLFTCLLFAGHAFAAEQDVPKEEETEAAGEGIHRETDAEAAAEEQHERIFLVNEYRYEPGTAGDNADTGQALCGTRCNALSVDYRNYLGPPGWRIIRIAKNKEVTVDLNNPYLDGSCICVADEYIVRVNKLYMTK